MRSIIVALAISSLASSAQATRLFGTTASGLVEIDPATAASHFVAPTAGIRFLDLSGRPGDTENIYGVHRVPGAAFRNFVAAIDVDSGLVTNLFDFVPADFGLGAGSVLELIGISISPSVPSRATITASTFSTEEPALTDTLLFDVDLGTGAISDLLTVSNNEVAFSLTEAPDGTIYTFQSLSTDWRPAILDHSTGQVSALGGLASCDGELCTDFTIEFDPDRDELLVVNRGGGLYRLSRFTGQNLGIVGETGVNIFDGLAFLPVPEPGTGTLLAIGLLGYGLASKGRGGSRHGSRRA